MNNLNQSQPNNHEPKKPSFWQVLVSVLGALVGVQSSRVQQRDFEHGHPWWVYALVWLGVVVLIILGLGVLTNWIIVSSKTSLSQ